MKFIKLIPLILIILYSQHFLNAQGFEWIRSWRLPSDSPNLFIGGYSGFGMNTEYVNAGSFSDVLECCGFKDGTGNDIRLGFTGEYWVQGDISLQGQIGLGITSANFNARREDDLLYPTDTGLKRGILTRDYTLNSQIHSLELALIAKKRLFASHFSVALGFSGAITLPNDAMHRLEMRVSATNLEKPPLKEGPYIPDEMVKGIEVSGFLFKPIIRTEYDIPIFNEAYLKPFIQLEYTLNSRVKRADSWESCTILGGFSVLFSY